MELLTVAGITAIISVLFTLVFQYVPGLRVKWAAIDSNAKKLIVLAMYLITGAVVGFGGCLDLLAGKFGLQCVEMLPFAQYAFAVLVAVGAGQGIFEILPELRDVTAAKAAR